MTAVSAPAPAAGPEPTGPRLIVQMCDECWFLGPKWLPRCPSCLAVNTMSPAAPEMCGHYFRTICKQPPLTAEGVGRAPRGGFDGEEDESEPMGGEEGGMGSYGGSRFHGQDPGGEGGGEEGEEGEGEEGEEGEGEEDEDDLEPVEPADVARVASFKSGGIVRLSSSDAGVDHVFSGGIPCNHAFMLAASPGGGKSTLCRQLAAGMAERGLKVMIAAAEETGDVTNEEFKRLKLYKRFPKGAKAVLFTNSDDTDAIIAAAKKAKVDILFVDSLSVLSSTRVEGAAGEKTQVNYAAYHLMQAAHASNEYKDTHPFTVIMISHVTKAGSMAGPNKAKHWTDGAFGLEHVNPSTLEASEDQEKGVTGYVRLRVLGKYRRGSTLNHSYYQMTPHGLVPWKPKDNAEDGVPGAMPKVGKVIAKVATKKGAQKGAAKTSKRDAKRIVASFSKVEKAAGLKKPAVKKPAAKKPAKKPAKKARKKAA